MLTEKCVIRNKILRNELRFVAENKLLFSVCVIVLQLNGQNIYHMLIYSFHLLMVTVHAFMVCLGNYAAEWGDNVPKIKVRGVIPCVANIFSIEGGGGIVCF